MQRAGAAAAAEIVRRFGNRLQRGVAVFAGRGNNGGDAWVVAGALAATGIRVRVAECGDPTTDDARAERDTARPLIEADAPTGAEALVIDGILGTGSSGAPRGAAAEGIARIIRLREAGAVVAALDVPSGVDASTGDATVAVTADLTVTFGTVKRGLLVARGRAGHIVCVDIGLGAHGALDDGAPPLVDRAWVAARIPAIEAAAHKGTRRRVAILGGANGMAGAAILAARAALRSGVGMARVIVDPASIAAVQAAVPAALARTWPATDDEVRESICEWAHVLVIGPGLGRTRDTRAQVERLLRLWRGPVVLDADALTAFARDAAALGSLLRGRAAVVTPHVVEFARLADVEPGHVLASRFDIGRDLAGTLGAIVLLKGVPTVLTAPNGRCLVTATGTPVLATGGSGDLLAGIVGTLLAQCDDALEAAACAAWIHGRAAELTGATGVRGATLDDVVASLARVWSEPMPAPRPPVLAELPAVEGSAASGAT